MKKTFKSIIWITLFSALICLTACATPALTKDSTFAEKAAAVCGDLQAAVNFGQIGLAVLQRDNWAFNYAEAQNTLSNAASFITMACATAQTEKDLISMRNAVLQSMALAAKQERNAPPWK